MNPFSLLKAIAFWVSDLLTGRNMLLLQMRHPLLYWSLAIPVAILPMVAVFAAALWFDGIISF